MEYLFSDKITRDDSGNVYYDGCVFCEDKVNEWLESAYAENFFEWTHSDDEEDPEDVDWDFYYDYYSENPDYAENVLQSMLEAGFGEPYDEIECVPDEEEPELTPSSMDVEILFTPISPPSANFIGFYPVS